MENIKAFDNKDFIKHSEFEVQQKNSIETEFTAKVANYFEDIYSYPPKIQIKWNSLDELNEDLFIGSNYGVLEHSVPLMDFFDDWFFNKTLKKAVSENYPSSKYFDGFLDKINSSNFFLKKTKNIQNLLVKIPVFVVVNGQKQIVLSKPSNVLGPKNFTNSVNEKLYDSCGAFDPSIEKKSELGLFFMSSLDAEKYLKECARFDFEGTQTVGLSIHCISLSSAYKITREYHPGIDFRFVPNLSEVKELLVKNVGKSDTIIEDEQQQLRFRRRSTNLFPFLKKLGVYLSPTSSFLQRNEYFKGVPIYIVQINEKPRNFFVEKMFNVIGSLDNVYNSYIQFVDSTIGFGHNWIMQGSLQDAAPSDEFETYIFLKKNQAIKFSKKNGGKVVRYIGGFTREPLSLEFMIRKPKIFVYNLEDFLEDWEDKLLGETIENRNNTQSLFQGKAIHFISPDQPQKFAEFNKTVSPLKTLTQSLNIKFKVLRRSVGILFSIT